MCQINATKHRDNIIVSDRTSNKIGVLILIESGTNRLHCVTIITRYFKYDSENLLLGILFQKKHIFANSIHEEPTSIHLSRIHMTQNMQYIHVIYYMV